MGTYLSTPVVEKCEENGTDLNGHPGCAKSSRPVNWGVVDMQGWRKSMEDAHIARTDVEAPALPPGVAGDAGRSGPTNTRSTDEAGDEATTSSDQPATPAIPAAPSDEPGQIASVANDATQEPAKVFAVFDGHGGPEVARFCQLYLVDVLTSQKEWNKASLVGQDASPASTDIGTGEPQPSPLGSTAPNIGKALIESFHALDRMIDDPSRREELTLLRSEKPQPGQHKSVTEGGGKPIPTKDGSTPCLADETESEDEATDDEAEKTDDVTGDDNVADDEGHSAEEEKKEKEDCATTGTSNADGEEASTDDNSDEKDKDTGKDAPAIAEENKVSEEDKEEEPSDADTDNVGTDTDSTASVGGGDSIVNDGLDDGDVDLDGGDDADGEDEDGMISTADAVALFQKLLTMSGSSGTVEVEVEGGDSDESGGGASKSATATLVSDDGSGTPSQPAAATATAIGPNAAQPTRIQNGRQVCNLPDHPIHAGCTSVVAVLVGNTVTVANAGDSRAVLCRAGGVTEALSFDHKPLQERERNRIATAGGFVNQFGRVNGNLNLSRSIGDMKYKQVPGIPPSGQMITAEPDIVQVTLNSADEFLVLGCDGIWDCLTNEEAVKYVRDRINEKTPIEIGREMLDEIISDDPRASQGIGGDNMTVMIIDLQPESRSYFE